MLKLVLFVAYQTVFTLIIALYTTIICLVKQFIPYRYRCKSVSGELILITGAGSGLGKLMAHRFSKLGAKLVLVDIDEKANEKTANEILMQGGVVTTFTCDLSKREDIYRMTDEVKKKVGEVQILINNAGIVTGKKFLESSDNAIEKTMQVNAMAHFWLCKAFLPAMLEKNHGHIVTIASMAGIYGVSGLCDYSASKFAAFGFNESLRNEFARLNKTGVYTTCVCPFYINTGMFEGVKTSDVTPMIEAEYAADKIVEAVLTNQTMLLMPRIMYLFYFFKGMFSTDAEIYCSTKFIKTAYSMDEFIGRNKVK